MNVNLGPTGKRRKTRRIMYGSVAVGGDAPISIQSMTTCPASEAAMALEQIAKLANAGCEIVRVSVKTSDDVESLSQRRVW